MANVYIEDVYLTDFCQFYNSLVDETHRKTKDQVRQIICDFTLNERFFLEYCEDHLYGDVLLNERDMNWRDYLEREFETLCKRLHTIILVPTQALI